MRGAILNPIRFYQQTEAPDYVSKFPNMDNVTQRQGYHFGVGFAPSWYRTHIGHMYLQFQAEIEDDMDLEVYKYDADTDTFINTETLTGTDISPAGWIDKPIYYYDVDLDEGTYYLVFSNGYTSDQFVILDEDEDAVMVELANSENDFGCIFGSYLFTYFLIGRLEAGDVQNEVDSFISDRGVSIKLNSTPMRSATLHLMGLHQTYKDMVNLMFSCDTLTVNGVQYVNTEPISVSEVSGSDLIEINVKLNQVNNDYYYDAY